jgi:hypothetical protein
MRRQGARAKRPRRPDRARGFTRPGAASATHEDPTEMILAAAFDFARRLPVRLGMIRKLIRDPLLSRTYYPDQPRKGKGRILLELLWWLLRHQEVNQYYYCYGLDRRGARADDYAIGAGFRKLRDRANAAANAAATRGDTRGRRLNYRTLMGDKFVFNRYLQGLGLPVPKVVALGDHRSIRWLDDDRTLPVSSLLERPGELFLKVLFADGGGQVFPLRVEAGRLIVNGQAADAQAFLEGLSGQYMLQERVRQHPAMSRLYPHSVNTIRVVTIFDGRSIQALGAVLRTGAMGGGWDNWSTGGLAVGVDLQTGRLTGQAVRAPKYGGGRFDRHPDTQVAFRGFEIPHFLEAVRLAKRAHSFFYGFHSIGWDVAVTPEGPTFLEANDDWGIAGTEACSGPVKRKFLSMLPKPPPA